MKALAWLHKEDHAAMTYQSFRTLNKVSAGSGLEGLSDELLDFLAKLLACKALQ